MHSSRSHHPSLLIFNYTPLHQRAERDDIFIIYLAILLYSRPAVHYIICSSKRSEIREQRNANQSLSIDIN